MGWRKKQTKQNKILPIMAMWYGIKRTRYHRSYLVEIMTPDWGSSGWYVPTAVVVLYRTWYITYVWFDTCGQVLLWSLKPLGEIPSLACEPVFVFVLVLVLVFVLVLFLHVHVLVCLVLDTWTAAVRVIFIRVLSVSSRVVVLLVFSAVFSCCCSCCV